MKQWKVRQWCKPYDVPVDYVVELGDASNKFDVKQQLKREGQTGEILDIRELVR